MFDKTPTIKSLYDQINDFEAMTNRFNRKRQKTYGITVVILFIALFLFIFNTKPNQINPIIFLSLFSATCLSVFAFLQINLEKKDLFKFLWPRSENTLKDKKAEIIHALSREKNKIDIVNFKFTGVNQDTVNELKKSLALKEYDNAYNNLNGILKTLVSLEEQKMTEAQTKKLIAEYELGLKMKL